MEKKTREEYILKIFRGLFILIFVLGSAYLLYYCTHSKDKGTIPEKVTYIKNWTYTVDGGEYHRVTLPIEVDAQKGQRIEFHAVLPMSVTDGMWVAFNNSKNIQVYVNGAVRYQWDRSEADVPGGPAEAVYMFVPVHTRDAGKIITIVKYGDKTYNGGLESVIVGDSLSVYNELKRREGFVQFMLAWFIFILSLGLVFGGLFLRKEFNQNIYLINISLGIMATSSWLIVNSKEFQLLTGRRFVNGILAYILTLIMIFPYIYYIDAMQKHRYRVIYAALCVIEAINFAVCVTLHFSRIANFYEMLKALDIVLVWIILVIFACTLLDVIQGRAKEYIFVAFGLGIFMLSGIVEVIIINSKLYPIDGVSIIFGLAVLMVTAIIQQIRDISIIQNQKNVEIETAKARNEFLANMSHEIRTPINAILGMNEMILRGGNELDIKEYAKNIGKSGQLLLSIVNDIFDFADFRNGVEQLNETTYDVRKMLDGVVTVLREHALVKDIGVNVGLPGNLPDTLYGDPQAIERVLSNINSNAVKFTEKGSVTFVAEYTDDENDISKGILTFYIKDTGRGIKEDELPTVFEAINHGSLKDNPAILGVGLGLPITKKIVDRMGGTITVESEYGKGALFTVIIPQQKVKKSVCPGSSTADKQIFLDSVASKQINTANVTNTNSDNNKSYSSWCDAVKSLPINYIAPKAHILAVDDNNANLMVITQFLKALDAQVDVATGGQEAIDICENRRYDIIFMDHMMPEPDGITAMQAIKSSVASANRNTPIVVVTANAVGNCCEEYIKRGFDGYLSKPVDYDMLLKVVRYNLKDELIIETVDKDNEELVEEQIEIAPNADGPIDFAGLATRFGNQQEVIDMILSECVKESERKKQLLRDVFEAGDIARYGVEAHGLKGVMASICAMSISEHAKAHEFAAKEGRIDFIKEDIDSFLKEYADTIEYISDYLSEKGISVVKSRVNIESNLDDNDNLTTIIECIEDALNDFDADKALSYIDRLDSVVKEAQIDIVKEIRQHADDFQYDLAIESLKKLK